MIYAQRDNKNPQISTQANVVVENSDIQKF